MSDLSEAARTAGAANALTVQALQQAVDPVVAAKREYDRAISFFTTTAEQVRNANRSHTEATNGLNKAREAYKNAHRDSLAKDPLESAGRMIPVNGEVPFTSGYSKAIASKESE